MNKINKYSFDDMDIEWFIFDKKRKRMTVLFDGYYNEEKGREGDELCELNIEGWDEIQVVKIVDDRENAQFVSTEEVQEFHYLIHKERMKHGVFEIYVSVSHKDTKEDYFRYRFINPIININMKPSGTYKTILTAAELPELNPSYTITVHIGKALSFDDIVKHIPSAPPHDYPPLWNHLENALPIGITSGRWFNYYVINHQDVSRLSNEELTKYCRFMLRQRKNSLRTFFVFSSQDMNILLPIINQIVNTIHYGQTGIQGKGE